jgi:predicted ribosome quality control (RQC) complex YloA/Tae2 family protein
MDPKRELSSVDLSAFVSEMGAYEGAVLDKAYLYGDDLLRLKLRDFDRGRLELLVEVGEQKRAHLAAPERVPDAPGRPPDFAKMLRNRIAGANLAGVEQFEFDRILQFRFEREDRDTTIVAELFGDGNVAVLDANRDVIDCLDVVRLQSRTVAPGSRYEFPASRVNPLSVEEEAFRARMAESDTDLVRTLATQLNLGGLYAEELCTRAGVEKTRSIDAATDEDYAALYDAIAGLQDDLETGSFDPRVYYEGGDADDASGDAANANGGRDADDANGGRNTADANGGRNADDASEDGDPVDATPFPLQERERAGLKAEPHDTFNDALDAYFHELREADREGGDGEPDRPDFEDEIAKRERIIDQQAGAIERFEEQAEAEREKAETLYAEYDLVDEILGTVREAREAGHGWAEIEERLLDAAEEGVPGAETVRGVIPEEGLVTVELDGHEIDLDPTEGVEKNANRLYNEAKRIEGKKEGAEAALEDTREELADLKERREAWEAREKGDAGETEDDDDGEDDEIDWLARESIPIRESEEWYERFRWFHTSDGYLVLGGRDADDNEALVKKYLERGDRFFHAQASGAPVTILKATGPSEPATEVDFPETTLRQAAQFAVSYSSVWKAGRYAGDAYMVSPDQVSKTPESGEYVEKGSFVIRGDRTYFEDTPVGCAVGIQCEPETRVIGGPPDAIAGRAETTIKVEPGEFAQADAAKRIYRAFRERFADTAFVRKVASPDLIGEFLPPGGSRIKGE